MVGGGGFGSGGPTGHMTYVLYCLYSTWVGRGGGGLVGNNTLQLKFSSICFYCIISSKPWGGGGGSRSDYSRHLYILGCAGGGGVQGYLFIPCTKTKKTRRLLSLSTKFCR